MPIKPSGNQSSGIFTEKLGNTLNDSSNSDAAISIPGASALGDALSGQRKVRYILPIANNTGPQSAIKIQKVLASGVENLRAANTPAPRSAAATPKARTILNRSILSANAPR